MLALYAIQLVRCDFDARPVNEVAHAQLAETERSEGLFSLPDAGQLLRRDALAIRQPRR